MSTQIASFTLSAEARYLVNGVEHGIGGILNSAANKGASWQHFYRVTGTTALQTVQVQLRDDSAATATIADLQIIAFLLPTGTDFQYTETEAIQAVPSPWTTYESLSFTPSAPGTYLIMALANGTEDPGTGGIGIRLEDPAATFWPDQSGGNRLQYMSNTRIPWQSYFLARAENLTATPQTYNLQATGDSGSGSQLRYTRLMAFRTDVLDSFETTEDTAISSTTSTTPVVRSVLNTAAPPSARDYIVLQSLVLSGTASVDENRAGFETDDVVKLSYDHVFNGSFHYTSFGFFDALTSSAAVKYENTFSTSNGASAVEAKESVIHVLRLPPPPTNYRSIGTAADYVAGTVNATNGSAVVTGTGTAWRTANRGIGDWITINGGDYTILSVDSEVQLTLTASFVGTTGPYATDIRRHFTTLQEWEDCISLAGCPGGYPFAPPSASLVADNRAERGIAYNDSVFTAGATIDSSTTDATHNITLTVAPGNRHDGIAGTGVVLDGANTDQGIRVQDDYTVIEWFELTRNRGSLSAAALVVQNVSNVLIRQVIIHDFLDLGNLVTGIRAQSNSDYTVRNCIIYDGGRAGIRNNDASATGLVENCTIYGMVDSGTGTGILHSSGTLSVTNTISMGNEIDFNGTIAQSFNLSSDATASGPSSLTGKAPALQFVNITPGDEANWDLHLILGADALDAGTDLSPAFVIDIDAQIRPWGAQWDMGADERPLASSCPVTQQAWFDQDWQFRKAVVVQSSQVTAVLTDFPVLVNLASDAEMSASAQDDGDDIVFTSSDGVTKLSHEIEKFCGGVITPSCPADTGELVAWVKVPYLSSGADTTIYMYYGNATVGNQEDVANVWDSNFKAVWHLKEELAGVGNVDLYKDSTANANHGDDNVSAAGQGGQIDGGQAFDGVDDLVFLADPGGAWDFSDGGLDAGTSDFAILAWFLHSTGMPESLPTVAAKGAGTSTQAGYWFHYNRGNDALDLRVSDGANRFIANSNNAIGLAADGWHHVAVVFDREAGLDSAEFFLDGGSVGSESSALIEGNSASGVEDVGLGARGSGSRPLMGNLDEVRISSGLRSASWIQTEYNNQWAPSTFYTVCSATTAVELASFDASGLDGAVDVAWETSSELNNLGFHVYRATTSDGAYERVTASAIPGLGSSPVRARYSYRDAGLTNGVTYYYKLEDIETTGKTEFHGPVSATPGPLTSGSGSESGSSTSSSGQSSSASLITFGDPSGNSLRILKRSSRQLVLELITEGFYAEPQEDGSVRLEVPGFESLTELAGPGILVKRTWVEAIAGRKVELVSVTARGVEAFTGLHPSDAEVAEIVATPEGTIRAARRGARKAFRGEGLSPTSAARIVSVGFQGEVKKALVELAPLRWDASRGQLLLARRLLVRVSFRGREPSELSTDGVRGRRYARRRSHDQRAVVARLLTKQRGLHSVRYEEMMGGRRGVRAKTLRLSRQGETVAFHLEPNPNRFKPGSTLYFMSAGASVNPYGNEAVYELEVAQSGEAGKSMPEISGAPSGESTRFYWHRAEWEENRYYQAALLEAPDLWLWDLLFAPVVKSYPFEVSNLAPSSEASTLNVWLQGVSDFRANPDHHVRVCVRYSNLAHFAH